MSITLHEETPVVTHPTSVLTLPWADVTTGSAKSEILTSQELLMRASLDWDVALRPLYRRMTDGSFIEHTRAKEVYRTDSEVSLGVVRGHYHPWPNREAFSPWDEMIKTGTGTWQDAGAQRNGARVFMTMLMSDSFSVLDNDAYDYYLFIGVGHDGYVAINPSMVPVRQKTQTHSAFGENSIRVQHTPSLESKKAEVRQVKILAEQYKTYFTERVTRMAETSVDEACARLLIDKTLNPKRTRRSELVDQIMSIFLTTTDYPHTGYGLFNALTQWQCHMRKHRQGNARFDTLMWGEDAKARNRLVSIM